VPSGLVGDILAYCDEVVSAGDGDPLSESSSSAQPGALDNSEEVVATVHSNDVRDTVGDGSEDECELGSVDDVDPVVI
jgi:hypothetical protein